MQFCHEFNPAYTVIPRVCVVVHMAHEVTSWSALVVENRKSFCNIDTEKRDCSAHILTDSQINIVLGMTQPMSNGWYQKHVSFLLLTSLSLSRTDLEKNLPRTEQHIATWAGSPWGAEHVSCSVPVMLRLEGTYAQWGLTKLGLFTSWSHKIFSSLK